MTAAYFLHIVSFYFLAKWTPRIVGAMFPALPPGTGPRVLALTNFGGAAGGILFGLLAGRIGLKPLTIVIMALNAATIMLFGRTPDDLTTLTWLAIAVGFFGNAAISGMYSIVAYAFPTHGRPTRTGFVIGVGRAGGVLSPWLAGILFDPSGNLKALPVSELPWVAIVMAMGSLLAGAVLIFLRPNLDRWANLQLDGDYEADKLESLAVPFAAANGKGLRVDFRGPKNPSGGPMMGKMK